MPIRSTKIDKCTHKYTHTHADTQKLKGAELHLECNYKNSSGDEIANVNFYAVRPEATRIR